MSMVEVPLLVNILQDRRAVPVCVDELGKRVKKRTFCVVCDMLP